MAACRREEPPPAALADATATDVVARPAADGPSTGIDADALRSEAGAVDGASPSAGCGRASALYRAGSQSGTITSAGGARTFVVHVPTGYDPARPAPLVLLFHGGLGTGSQMEASSLMSPIADREGFVVAYPDGLARSWNGGGCCGPPATDHVDDVRFVADLLDHLEGQLCLDRRRVYTGGMSNGAIFSHRLACDLADRIAAASSTSGANMASPCQPARPISMLEIHGTADHNIPFAGGPGCGISGAIFPSVADTISSWVTRDGCTLDTPTLVVAQGDGRCERQARCPDGIEVILCTIAGRGHSWPGGMAKQAVLPACMLAGDGGQSDSFIASEQLWAYFQRHALP